MIDVNVIVTMKMRLKRELAERHMSVRKLAAISYIGTQTIVRYTNLNDPTGGKVEIWLALSEALGHEGLEWLIKEE